MPRVMVVVVGLPGSGKSRVAELISGGQAPIYVMGDVVRARLREKGLPITLENLMREAEEIRREHGRSGVALLLSERISQDPSTKIVVDGARSLDEVRILSRGVDCLRIVAVMASPHTRLNRLRSRGREGDPMNMQELLRRDLKELGFGLGHLIALADHVVVNEGGPEELEGLVEGMRGVLWGCSGESVWRYL